MSEMTSTTAHDAAVMHAPETGAPAENAVPSSKISTEELAYWSQQSGLPIDTPARQEKMAKALEDMRPYMRMELSDPRFTDHAKHMGIDVQGMTDQLQAASEQLKAMEQDAVEMGNQLSNNQSAAAKQVIAGGVLGIIAGTAATWASITHWKLIKENISKGWKRNLTGAGIGVATLAVVSAIYDAVVNGRNKARIVENQKKQESMVDTYVQAEEQIGNYVSAVRNQFVVTHLQRSLAEKPKVEHAKEHVPTDDAKHHDMQDTYAEQIRPKSAPEVHEQTAPEPQAVEHGAPVTSEVEANDEAMKHVVNNPHISAPTTQGVTGTSQHMHLASKAGAAGATITNVTPPTQHMHMGTPQTQPPVQSAPTTQMHDMADAPTHAEAPVHSAPTTQLGHVTGHQHHQHNMTGGHHTQRMGMEPHSSYAANIEKRGEDMAVAPSF